MHWLCGACQNLDASRELQAKKEMFESFRSHGLNLKTPTLKDLMIRIASCGSSSDLPMVELLIASGAEVNVGNKEGMTPLHYASSWPIAKALIDGGARLDAVGHISELGFRKPHTVQQYWSRLSYEYSQEHPKEKVNPYRDLLDGLDSTGATGHARFGECSLTKADYDLVTNALKTGEVRGASEDGDTPLHIAVGCGTAKDVQKILEGHPDLNTANKAGRTPLFNILTGCSGEWEKMGAEREEMLRLLKGAGADFSHQGEEGTVLHRAAWGGCWVMVKPIAQAFGPGWKTENTKKLPPQFLSANLQTAKAFTELGANHNETNSAGESWLQHMKTVKTSEANQIVGWMDRRAASLATAAAPPAPKAEEKLAPGTYVYIQEYKLVVPTMRAESASYECYYRTLTINSGSSLTEQQAINSLGEKNRQETSMGRLRTLHKLSRCKRPDCQDVLDEIRFAHEVRNERVSISGN